MLKGSFNDNLFHLENENQHLKQTIDGQKNQIEAYKTEAREKLDQFRNLSEALNLKTQELIYKQESLDQAVTKSREVEEQVNAVKTENIWLQEQRDCLERELKSVQEEMTAIQTEKETAITLTQQMSENLNIEHAKNNDLEKRLSSSNSDLIAFKQALVDQKQKFQTQLQEYMES